MNPDTGTIDFGEGTSRIYAQGKHYQILAQDGEYSQLVVNEYGKGHSVYFAGPALLPAELPHFAARHLLRRRYAGGDEALLRDQRRYRGHGIPRNEAHCRHQQRGMPRKRPTCTSRGKLISAA